MTTALQGAAAVDGPLMHFDGSEKLCNYYGAEAEQNWVYYPQPRRDSFLLFASLTAKSRGFFND